jgi:predicted nucleic acid-binding protein
MTVLFDTGALIAIERDDKSMLALLASFRRSSTTLKVPAGVIAQVWRDGSRQAKLARFLNAAEEIELTGEQAREIGALLGRSQSSDVIDASVALLARHGDTILTSDISDMKHLINHRGMRTIIVRC